MILPCGTPHFSLTRLKWGTSKSRKVKMDASKMMLESERYNYPEDPDLDDELEEEVIDGYEF